MASTNIITIIIIIMSLLLFTVPTIDANTEQQQLFSRPTPISPANNISSSDNSTNITSTTPTTSKRSLTRLKPIYRYEHHYDHEEVELDCELDELFVEEVNITQLPSIAYEIQWTLRNSSVHRVNGEYVKYKSNNSKLILANVGESDSGTYKCEVVLNDKFVNFNEIELTITGQEVRIPPHITHPPTNHTVDIGANVTFTCKFIESNLLTFVYWFRVPPETDKNKTDLFWSLYKNLSSKDLSLASTDFSIEEANDKDVIHINNITQDQLGGYGCHVTNDLGYDVRIGYINLLPRIESSSLIESSQSDYRLQAAICFLSIAFIGSLIYIYYRFKMTALSPTINKDIQTNDLKDAVSNWTPSVDTRLTSIQSSMYDFLPYNGSGDCNSSLICNPFYGQVPMAIEFTGNKIEFIKVLGKGDFGEVWKCVHHGSEHNKIVAVKRIIHHDGFVNKKCSSLLDEIEIMKQLGKHPNVVQFHGCCTKENMPVYLIMEFVEKGGLIDYLRKSRTYINCGDNYLTSKDLISFSLDIAKGMEYVSSQGIIHRDLAARNILLSSTNTCKVADFGFARKINDGSPYEKKSDDKVPVRWMAPESFPNRSIYTTKSDVFSFGILIWEIVTLGSTPYEKLTTGEVMEKVCMGERLARPKHCKEELFAVMLACWSAEPNDRPQFGHLAQQLAFLSSSTDEYIELDKYQEKDHSYYNILSNNPNEKL